MEPNKLNGHISSHYQIMEPNKLSRHVSSHPLNIGDDTMMEPNKLSGHKLYIYFQLQVV